MNSESEEWATQGAFQKNVLERGNIGTFTDSLWKTGREMLNPVERIP